MDTERIEQIAFNEGYRRGYEQGKADAVSVVRCKDCKWRNTKRCIINFFAEDLTDDKFCAWGERKDDVYG